MNYDVEVKKKSAFQVLEFKGSFGSGTRDQILRLMNTVLNYEQKKNLTIKNTTKRNVTNFASRSSKKNLSVVLLLILFSCIKFTLF